MFSKFYFLPLLFPLIITILLACNKAEINIPQPLNPIDSTTCADGAEITINEIMIQNNVWEKEVLQITSSVLEPRAMIRTDISMVVELACSK